MWVKSKDRYHPATYAIRVIMRRFCWNSAFCTERITSFIIEIWAHKASLSPQLYQARKVKCVRVVYFVYVLTILGLEEFEDTKGEFRIRIPKKNRQHNGQKKKYKRTNNDLKHIKLKIE